MEIIPWICFAVAAMACLVLAIKGAGKIPRSQLDKALADYQALQNEFLTKKSALEHTEGLLDIERENLARERSRNEAVTAEVRLKSELNAAAQQKIESLQAQFQAATRQIEQEKATILAEQQARSEMKDRHHAELTTLKEALAGAQSEAKAASERLKEVAGQLATEQQAHQALAAGAKAAAESQTQTMQETMSQHHKEVSDFKQKLATAEANLKAGQERLTEQQAFLEETRKKMEETFAQLASRSLDTANDRYQTQNSESLIKMLTPFREQIESFKKEVSEKHVHEIADRNALKGEITKIVELNQALSQQTQDLTRALTTKSQEQGAYGEDLLETILTNAGMQRDHHYFVQGSGQNEAGERIRPDFIIRCPDNREIIVDSKVSLTAYVRYCNERTTDAERKAAQAEVYQSIRAHIEGLSAKRYHTIKDRNVAGLVLMFMPFEGAYTVAAQHKDDLRDLALKHEIFLVTPGNLLLVVKLVTDLWTKDKQDRSILEITDRAFKLYEKAHAFITEFEKVGDMIEKTHTTYDSALKKLATGGGNLMSQGKMLRSLIGKGKELPQTLRSIRTEDPEEAFATLTGVDVAEPDPAIVAGLPVNQPKRLNGGLPD